MKTSDFIYIILNFLEKHELTHHEAAAYLNVVPKTLSNWKSGDRKPGRARMKKVLRAIEHYPFGDEPVPEFSLDKIIRLNDQRLLINAMQSLLNCAYDIAINAARAAIIASFNPYLTINPLLNLSHKKDEDYPYVEDIFASRTAEDILRKYISDKNHILGYGLMKYDEESGLTTVNGINNNRESPNNRNLIIFVDPLDGSHCWCEQRRVFGSSVVSFYHLELGFICAVCIDISGRRIYQKIRGIAASCNSLTLSDDPADGKNHLDLKLLRGAPIPLVTTGVKKLTPDTALNIYRSTPNREKKYRTIIDLLNEKCQPKFIHSLPGTSAVCLTALGGLSGCIEVAEGYGFRPWDFVGTFICSDNCFVCDENGTKIDFNEYRIRHEYILSGFKGKHMDDCRQKFIVTATQELAHQILETINES